MTAPKDLACAATAAVTLLALVASFCIVSSAATRTFDATPVALALVVQGTDNPHSTGELK